MNSDQLEKALKEEKEMCQHFRGVFARDTLPKNPDNGFYIINFDKTGEPGSHWVGVEIGKNFNTYFDSYGRAPPPFDHLHKFLSGKKIRRNQKQVQHHYSTTCGQWCMYFIWRRCNGWNMKNITAPFRKKALLINDHVMNHLIRKKFQLDKKVIDIGGVCYPYERITVMYEKTSEGANTPCRAAPEAAGYDVYSAEAGEIPPGETRTFTIQTITKPSVGFHLKIYNRSGLACKE